MWLCAKKREAKTLKNNSKKTQKNFFVYRVSGAYCGFMVLVLLSKIEEIDTFKSTNLHQNAVKTYLKVSQI